MSEGLRASYDETPYRSYPFPRSQPDRLALIGRLFGMAPPPIERCRVLELGCASGGNLIPLAARLPQAEFVGIDFSPVQVGQGVRDIEALGLANIRLQHRDIRDLGAEVGTFDYIVAHGVYSWIPDDVQEKLLALCAAQLAPSGVAYVSYNTLPGWGMRGVVRTAMRYHTRQFSDAAMRVQQARAMLEFLAESLRDTASAYGSMLRSEAEWVRTQPDFYLLHDHLEEVNEPIYFFQFVERVARHGLRYLGETEFKTMMPGDFPVSVAQTLARIAPDVLKREQLMDFLRNRAFRETLLVQEGVTLNRKVSPDRLMSLHVASAAQSVGSVDPKSAERTQFRAPDGAVTATTLPLAKAAMQILADAWPATLPFDRLCATASERAGLRPADTADARGRLASHLLHCFAAGIIELHTEAAPYVAEPGPRPQASPVAILQARRGATATSLRHESVPLSADALPLLPLLDGTRTRREIAAIAWPEDPEQTAAAKLDRALAQLARQALLVQ